MTTAIRWAVTHASSLLVIIAVLLAGATPAAAQTRVEGQVTDPEGRPVANATVLVVGARTGTESAASDENGRFAIDSLGPGQYDFTASAPGLFGEARGVAIAVNSG